MREIAGEMSQGVGGLHLKARPLLPEATLAFALQACGYKRIGVVYTVLIPRFQYGNLGENFSSCRPRILREKNKY